MKKSLLLLGLLSSGIIIVGCSSGSTTGMTTPVYLESGTYNVVLTNIAPAECADNIDTTVSNAVTSNGSGQVCTVVDPNDPDDQSTCFNVNLAYDPCMTYSEIDVNSSANMMFSGCQLNSTGMTADMVINVTANNVESSCSATVRFTNAS